MTQTLDNVFHESGSVGLGTSIKHLRKIPEKIGSNRF